MPNVPTMQGYERQKNAVVAIELEKWRQDPTGFRTQHRDHIYLDSA